jgi:uncharacterized protein (TIGR03435 family)
MIGEYLSTLWKTIAPALADHLWQSTLFAVVAGLLTLTLRKNRAGARYWLWLAASVKFLLPFSLLAVIGSHLSWLRAPAPTGASLSFTVEEISRPFTRAGIGSQVTGSVSPNLSLLPLELLALWLCGFFVVLLVWYARWRRISAAIRDAVAVRGGRELEALRRVENSGGLRARIELVLSRASLEPGIFGIVKPVMVWPQGISARLDDAHMEAILAHELWHVRRRDNLAAAAHMVVEAVFWFHPLVWWLGARLVEERERACDEEVVELGGDRQIYAESILKVCEFCVGSPLACVAGVTGADLKKRIVQIMTKNVVRKLDFSRKILLGVAAFVTIALPVGFGVLHAEPGRAQSVAGNATVNPYAYRVTTLKPNKSTDKLVKLFFTPEGFTATGMTLQGMIKVAYKVEDNQISGAPKWLSSYKFDLEATIDKPVAEELKKLNPDQRSLAAQHMLQALLADKFKLTLHGEAKELPMYTLVIAPGGPKLQEAKPGDSYPNGIKDLDGVAHPGMMRMGPGTLTGQALGMSNMVDLLSHQLGTQVVDKTGLTGKYDLTLHWTPDEHSVFKDANGDAIPAPDTSGPPLITAIQEQLGLELKPAQAQVQILAIDHVGKPAEN